MDLKLRYGLLLVVPSLLIIIVAWVTGAWSTNETEAIDETTSPGRENSRSLDEEIETQVQPEDAGELDHRVYSEEATSRAESDDEFLELAERATAFTEELHSRDPQQSAEERESRLRRLATEQFWNDISLFISSDSDDATLIEHGLSVEAHVEAISIEPLSTRRAVVVTELDIVVYSNGDIYTSYQPRHTSIWILEDEEWLVNEASYAN